MTKMVDRKSRFTFVLLLVLLSAPYCLLPNRAQGQSEDFRGSAQEIVQLVRDHFYDSKRANAWASKHANYANQADNIVAFSGLTRRVLSELNTSHTDFYTPSNPEYYGLLSIYSQALGVEAVEFESVGADFTTDHFVRVVFAGGSAAQAGLHRGDKILRVDGKDFDAVASFRGKTGQPVTLTVERVPGKPAIEVAATVRKLNPKQEWLEAQRLGSRIIERRGRSIAYVGAGR